MAERTKFTRKPVARNENEKPEAWLQEPPNSENHVSTDPAQKPNEDKELEAWLQKQGKKLEALGVKTKNLKAKKKRLKLDTRANAKAKGRILRVVRNRLKGMPGRFKKWVLESTDIGYSTALWWIDLDRNSPKVKNSDSNKLESSQRQVRDAIRDMRQAEGNGKPGSGRRKGNHEPQAEHKGSLAWGLRQRWEINQAEPDFNPPQQSEEDFTAARLCFQNAMKPGSTYATVAQATETDEEEVKRLLRSKPTPTTPSSPTLLLPSTSWGRSGTVIEAVGMNGAHG